MWRGALVVLVSLAVAWLAFLVFLLVASPKRSALREVVRVLPDTMRLVRRLATDRSIARSARVPVWLLLVYLALPFDVVPDFLPVVGYADDVILTALVLRYLMRRAGPEKLTEHWSGSAEGLTTLRRVLRLPESS